MLAQNIRIGLRTLRKNAGFTSVAVLVLALGIGANTAIFSVVNAALLRPLPFPDAERLVQVWHVPPAKSFPGLTKFPASAANYLDWHAENHVFQQTAIYRFSRFNLTGNGEPEPVDGAAVSGNFFSVLGTPPKLGRAFLPEEDQPGHSRVAILSYALWQNRFGGDPSVVGKEITLDGQGYTVVGVMPAAFSLPSKAGIWTPMAWTSQERVVHGEHHYLVIARLKPGVDLKQAQAEMSTISRNLEQQYPEDDKGWGAVIIPLREELVGDLRPALLILLGAVAFVLLIACANVANLVLVKTLARRKEIAIRAALGASRGRVIALILTETVMVALAGGALGLIVAHFGIDLIVAFLADKLAQSVDVHLDGWVLGFTLSASLLSGVIAGLVPAWHLTKPNMNEALKEGLGRTDADASGGRTRSALVIAEVAVSLLLLIGAGLMIRTLRLLREVDPGIDPHNVLTMSVAVPFTKYDSPAPEIGFFDRVLQRVRTLPGVESAGVIDDLPLSGQGSNQPIAIAGRPVLPMAEQPEVAVRVISPGYLRAMRIPLLRGREIGDDDTADRPAAVVISQSMAQRIWPNEDPIGKRLTMSFFPGRTREVVGIVGDVKQRGVEALEPISTLYFPLAQLSAPGFGGWHSFPLTLVVRAGSKPAEMISALSNAVHIIDPQVPLVDVTTMDDFITESLSSQRLNMLLLMAFAGLALMLAAIGIYSVLAYSVRQQVREIGIRMALGAQLSDVLRMVLRQGARLVLAGIAIGLVSAVGLTRVMASQLFGVTATDPVTFVSVSLLLAAVALLACYLPARRAAKVDPMAALRYE
jgi:putative ABC transport system permease protein